MICNLDRSDVERDPNLIWNSFIGIIASPREELEADQQAAHFAFIYESEVQNGGHLQYFENVSQESVAMTIDALSDLGANSQRLILSRAREIWLREQRVPASTAEEFIEAALRGEMSDGDAHFHECSPSLIEVLDEHLKANFGSYIQIH